MLVERRDFLKALRIHGLVEATQSYSVAAPRLTGPGLNTLIITTLVSSGSMVKKGSLLVEFDRQNQIKISLDRKAEFLDFEEQVKKKRAELAAAQVHDETELKQAETAVETARLEMLKNEVISRIDAEKNTQNLEEATAQLKQLRETFDLKRQAAKASIRILEIQRDRARNAMQYSERNTEKMSIRSPLDGLVVLNPIWKGGQRAEVVEGDEIRPGVPFMQVVNPSSMQVRARVNQVDTPRLRVGQPVQVRLDAYPDMALRGKIEQLGAIGITSGLSKKVRTFVTLISIEGTDPKLMPDLSAAVDVELERRKKVLVLPRDTLITEGEKLFVEVKKDGGFQKRTVTTGARSDSEIVIESGVSEGEIVRRQKAASRVSF